MPLASFVSIGSAVRKVTPSPSRAASALACSMSFASRAIGVAPTSSLAPSPFIDFIISMVSALMLMVWTTVPVPSALTLTTVSNPMQPAVDSARRGRIASGRKRMRVSLRKAVLRRRRRDGHYIADRPAARHATCVLRCPPPPGGDPMRFAAALVVLAVAVPSARSAETPSFDILIRGGTVYDGEGGAPRKADVGIVGDRITAVGPSLKGKARAVVEAKGLAVAPGFINMLSWSTESLIADGRSQSEIRQGVTTEVFGEGSSMGPYNEAMKKHETEEQSDIKYEITWTTLAEYLAFLEKKGVSPNVASFIGASTIREHVMGLGNRTASMADM